MRERLVRVGHAVCIFFLLHRIAAIVGCIQNFTGQPIRHRFLTTAARVENDPANRERSAALLVYFNRDLISRPTYATRLNLDSRFGVVDGALEDLEWLFTSLLAN